MTTIGIKELFDLNGKVAVITGAGRGIGKDISFLLANAGADVALISRSEQELTTVCMQIEALGRKALPIPFDLLNIKDMSKMIQSIMDHFGHIDILVNNAGLLIPKPALEVTEEDWDRTMDINLKSLFFMTQKVAGHMVGRHKGKIINISSQMGLVGFPNRSIYGASKGAVVQLTRALAIEWAPYQINVNSIAPTATKTVMTEKLYQDEKVFSEIKTRIPLGRIGETKDLFGAVLYLCSESSNLVTGHTVVVDGGWTVW